MCHMKFNPNSRRTSNAVKSTPAETEARLLALQEQCRALEEECRALREECRALRMQERKQVWKESWRY